ncbi:MAG TPA: vWA domain-containing protein [Gemmatimonadaceae bacterium]|nr:vWA domain-containing protein [Gemmatimonadaceae bacterium]
MERTENPTDTTTTAPSDTVTAGAAPAAAAPPVASPGGAPPPAATTDASASATLPASESPDAAGAPAADAAPAPDAGATVAAAAASAPAGVEQQAPAQPAPTPPPTSAAPPAKTKGVADIVFLVDVTGSMAPIIDALRRNIESFIDSLGAGDANNAPPVKDWRGRVVGYRDIETDRDWLVDNPFVRDAVALKAQLAALRAEGGGDEPESLLDALYKLATMEASPKGAQAEDPRKWRYRSDAARVVVVFTDASFRETMSIPEAKGGSLQDVANVVMANRIILSLFAPNMEGYDRLSQIDKSEWEAIEYPGLNPQEALQKFTADPANFRNTLKQLAASVSKSAATVAL